MPGPPWPGSNRWFDFSQARIPAEYVLVFEGVRCTSPAFTALELAATDGGEAIDTALRLRAARLDQLWAALAATSGRSGNAVRRTVLQDSRDEPWSAAERLAHRLLRSAGIRGWAANGPIVVAGSRYFGDIVFRTRRLVLEIDGSGTHADPAAFQTDRSRQNVLVNAGWRVLRFTWADLNDHPEAFISTVRTALRR
ncbi:endonuclease domain-containing protein [Naumannella halotolerans]|uniref:Very-short-patch-repair endonuclease n=1 Tax=Naumannella halotolerans TaxID=993414 RepID=A0A4R7IZA1_9ACTN|nr:DUF559 domain-containing protein [Naumannella halotolerans]TDT30060.1 very-short-patch-repair endonuclease [Naumannella halotolerans]